MQRIKPLIVAIGVQILEKGYFSLLYIHFEELHNATFCGSRAVDFAAVASDVICVPLSSSTSVDCDSVKEIIRRVFQKVYSDRSSRASRVLLLIDDAVADVVKTEAFMREAESMEVKVCFGILGETVISLIIFIKEICWEHGSPSSYVGDPVAPI